jgi:hypothetical protein
MSCEPSGGLGGQPSKNGLLSCNFTEMSQPLSRIRDLADGALYIKKGGLRQVSPEPPTATANLPNIILTFYNGPSAL